MKTTFFIDIDQTISTGYVGRDLAESVAYYRAHGVIVPDDIQSWPALFQLPDVACQHEVLSGARLGVERLSREGTLFYATARKSDIEQITRDWLLAQGFPRPDQVIFVRGVSEKLLALAEHEGPLVLVDDRWRQLLDILETYREHRVLRTLHTRLTLVAFGANAADLPLTSLVPVVPLPDWSKAEELLLTGSGNVVVSARKDTSE